MLYLICLTIFLYSLWALFEYLEGLFQGYYYSLYPSEKKHPNIHFLYMIMRSIVLLALGYIYYLETTWGLAIVFCTVCFFAAPFYHNGALYSKRNDLNPAIYKKRWWANKEPKTPQQLLEADDSEIEIEVKFRIGMMLVSVLFFAGLIIEIYNL